MFGMSAERNGVERTPRIAQCGHAPRVVQCGHAPEALRRRAALCSGRASGNFLINILSPGRLYEADIYVIIYSGQTPVFIKENIQLILYLI